MRKIAVVYATYDGINNCTSGVGTVTQSFIKSFSEVTEYYKNEKGVILNPYFIAIALNSNSSNFSNEAYNEVRAKAKKLGGDVSLVLNNSNGVENFGNIENWKAASLNAANKITDLAQNYDEIIVYAVDIPFLHIPYYFEKQKSAFPNLKIKYLLVLHSDELSLNPESPDIHRIGWESSIIKYANINPNIYVAKISNFHINHLIAEYSVKKDKIIDMQSGLNPNADRFKNIKQDKIKNILQNRAIPVDKNIIFSVGRAEWYKGFDLLIKAFKEANLANTHLVFISADYKTRDSYNNTLKQLLKDVDISCTAFYEADFDLPSIICQWQKTILVAQLSRHEPFGLVPEEVRLWGRKGSAIILASNSEGYKEQITDCEDGFLVQTTSIKEIADKINSIFHYNQQEIAKIRQNGLKRFSSDYDYRVSIYKSLEHLISGYKPDINQISNFRKNLSYDYLL